MAESAWAKSWLKGVLWLVLGNDLKKLSYLATGLFAVLVSYKGRCSQNSLKHKNRETGTDNERVIAEDQSKVFLFNNHF